MILEGPLRLVETFAVSTTTEKLFLLDLDEILARSC